MPARSGERIDHERDAVGDEIRMRRRAACTALGHLAERRRLREKQRRELLRLLAVVP